MNPTVRLPGFAPLMLAATLAIMGVLIAFPLAGSVFQQAFAKGFGAYLEPLDPVRTLCPPSG